MIRLCYLVEGRCFPKSSCSCLSWFWIRKQGNTCRMQAEKREGTLFLCTKGGSLGSEGGRRWQLLLVCVGASFTWNSASCGSEIFRGCYQFGKLVDSCGFSVGDSLLCSFWLLKHRSYVTPRYFGEKIRRNWNLYNWEFRGMVDSINSVWADIVIWGWGKEFWRGRLELCWLMSWK